MLRKLIFVLFIMGLLFTSSGCIANRATANLASGMDVGGLKIFYVVPQQDDRETCDLIKNNLFKRGYIIAGGSHQPSYQADVIVTYESRWTWDFTMYMLELTITFRDPTNNFPLAVGNSLHGSLTRKSPEEMVDEVLTSIFTAESTNSVSLFGTARKAVDGWLPFTGPDGLAEKGSLWQSVEGGIHEV